MKTLSDLADLALDAVNRPDDELIWNEFFAEWMRNFPIQPGKSGQQMAGEVLAAEVLRLRKALWETTEALSGEIKHAQLRANRKGKQ